MPHETLVHGRHPFWARQPVSTICECGRRKDYRSERCATCAGRGFPVASESPRIIPSREMVAEVLDRAVSVAQIARELGISRSYTYRLLERYSLDSNKIRQGRGSKFTDDQVFVTGSTCSRGVVRARFLSRTTSQYVCWECGQGSTWNNKPLVLQMDHINGDPQDNRLENLRWLCANCHTQTETFVGKNCRGVAKKRA